MPAKESTTDLIAGDFEDGAGKKPDSSKKGMVLSSVVSLVIGAAIAGSLAYFLKQCPAPGAISDTALTDVGQHGASGHAAYVSGGGTEYGIAIYAGIKLLFLLLHY